MSDHRLNCIIRTLNRNVKKYRLFRKNNRYINSIIHLCVMCISATKLSKTYCIPRKKLNVITHFTCTFLFSLFETYVYLNGIVKVSEYNANGFFYPILHIYIFVNAINSGNLTNNAIRLFLYIPIGLLDLLQ